MPSRLARPPRRPPGWVAPGPPPRGSLGRTDLEPALDEDLSYLAGDWRIFQKRQGHRWSLDDLVTAFVAAEQASELAASRFLDLGCGQGTVLLLMAWRFPGAQLLGLEAQAERAAMARRSVGYNGADGRVSVVEGDLRALSTFEQLPDFPLITGTPPYFPRGSGTESAKAHAMPCRFELRGGVEAYLDAALRCLSPGGRVVLSSTALARARVDTAAEARGLSLAHRLEVIPREGKAPLLLVDVFSRGLDPRAAPPSVAELVVRDRSLQWTQAFIEVRERFGMPTRPP